MVGAAAPRAARLDRIAVRVALGLRRPRRLPRAAGRTRHARRAGGVRRPRALLDRRLGSLRGRRRRRRPGALRARMGRAAPVCGRAAASGSSATSRSTSRRAAPTSQRTRSLFQTGVVAGAPPDGLSAFGQHWGNPLYDWSAMRAQGYRWWIERFRRTFELYDVARIDHFRGFVAYWAVPEHHKTAKHGRFRPGPGAELFRAAERELGPLPLVAEDLGRDHAAGGAAARPARHPRHGRDAVRLRGPAVATRTGSRTTPAERRLCRHARLRHRARLVAHAARAASAGRPASPGSSRTGS